MTMNRILGLVIFSLGLLLIKFAYDGTQAPIEEVTKELTGNYSDQTTWYFIGGLAATVGGGLLIAIGARR